jgi:hypothetical protein
MVMAIDETVKLAINGSNQRVRMCAERTGLPPILVVQAGPGFLVPNAGHMVHFDQPGVVRSIAVSA